MKEKTDVIKYIESSIDSCIEALKTRKAVLIREVTEKFKEKRMFMVNHKLVKYSFTLEIFSWKEFNLKCNKRK
jgi:hypothetical protein